MASSGPNSPGTAANNSADGSIAWTNFNNSKVEDGSSATATLDCELTQLLDCTNFGFAIDGAATINGITVEVKRKSDQTGTVVDYTVQLLKAGSPAGSNIADESTQWPASLAYRTYGGAADLWSTTWTPAQINNSGFGFRLQALEQCVGVDVAYVDHVRVTITYTGGASSGPTNLKTMNSVAKASIKTISGVAIASCKSVNGVT